MFQFVSKLRTRFIRLLYQRTVLILSLFCSIGILAALLNMSHVTSHMMTEQALQNASLYAQTLKTARTLYSSEVVSKTTENQTIKVTHDHINIDNAIPLPATYLIQMSEQISQLKPDLSIRLYSDYPFPWRQQTGGPQDEFEIDHYKPSNRILANLFIGLNLLIIVPLFVMHKRIFSNPVVLNVIILIRVVLKQIGKWEMCEEY